MTLCDWKNQKNFIKENFKKSLAQDDIWYVIDLKWFSKWKLFVQFDLEEHEESDDAPEEHHPGPIDNSNLIDNSTGLLKEKLLHSFEFELIPEESWHFLVKCYTIEHSEDEVELHFKRKVVSLTGNDKDLLVEVHLFPLRICQADNMQDVKEIQLSKCISLKELYCIIRNQYCNNQQNLETRLLRKESDDSYFVITLNGSSTLEDSTIEKNELLILEMKEKNQEWSLSATKKSSYVNGYGRNSRDSPPPPYRSRVTEPGVCGLTNLGNTCFMNSAIQCVSNVKELTSYFLSGQWENEINLDNPLGMQGKIAETYAKLLKTIWSGTTSTALTRDFKKAVAHFAPQFSGYSQHDSHELLMFLLDGLHEDLNRVLKKPYIEIKDADSGEDQVKVANESWETHIRRNDSVIVSLFHGLLKSTVICPDCKYVSVTFDPFSSLSLPLPNTREYHQIVHFVPSPFDVDEEEVNGDSLNILTLKVRLNKNGFVKDIQQAVSELMDCSPLSLVIADIHDHKIYQFFEPTDYLTRISPSDTIFAYKLPDSFNPSSMFYIPIYFRQSHRKNPGSNVTYSDEFFDHPQLVLLPKNKSLNYIDLAISVYRSISCVFGRLPIIDSEANQLSASDGEISCDELSEESNQCRNIALMLSEMIDLCFFSNDYRLIEIKSDFNPDSNVQVSLPSGRNRSLLAVWNVESRNTYYRRQEAVDHKSMSEHYAKKVFTLNDCFSLFTKEEQLGEQDLWYCRKCKQHKQGYKQFRLWDLPSVLILHLKRFSYGTYYRDKIDTPVDFPLKDLDLSEQVLSPHSKATKSCVYDLVAVSNHMGGLGGGHYTSYAKNPDNGNWYNFDDSYVSEVSESEVRSRNAYVLFYVRRNGKSTNSNNNCEHPESNMNNNHNNSNNNPSVVDDTVLMDVE